MFKRLSQSLCIIIFISLGDVAYALQCIRLAPAQVVANSDIVFVAFITDGYFVKGDDSEDCGWIEGGFEVVEDLKGDSASVTIARKRLPNCNGRSIGGASNRFPIGKYVLLTTNSEVADIGGCTREWSSAIGTCFVDNIRRHLNIEAVDTEMREWCINDANSRGELSRLKSLRMYIKQLENESKSISSELKELKVELEEYELGESPE